MRDRVPALETVTAPAPAAASDPSQYYRAGSQIIPYAPAPVIPGRQSVTDVTKPGAPGDALFVPQTVTSVNPGGYSAPSPADSTTTSIAPASTPVRSNWLPAILAAGAALLAIL